MVRKLQSGKGLIKMLKKIQSLIVSETVINMFLNHQSFDHSKIDGFIESYQNGREHGHIIWIPQGKDIAYYICQARRSDQICIYKGDYKESSISMNAYKHSNSFDCGDYDSAVEWLLKEFGMME